MRFPQRTAAERLRIAELSGVVQNLIVGAGKQVYAEPAIARLHAISSDPVLLGDVLGVFLADLEESTAYEGAVELLRLAGADEQTAQEMLVWQRERRERQRQTPTGFDIPGKQP